MNISRPVLWLKPALYFSYGQFSIYDRTIELPGLFWTDRHYSQGFARRDSNVCFRALSQSGLADVYVAFRSYEPMEEYQRVISVPFRVIAGPLGVEGPEEANLVNRSFEITPGNYRLVAAQSHSNKRDRAEDIHIFLSRPEEPIQSSEILLADGDLDPTQPLVESSEEP